MKKWLILAISIIGLGTFSQTAAAKETLLDNELDLKTDRLNKEQGADNKTQSFIAEDRLFDAEMIERVKHAEEVQAQAKEQEKAEYFLVEAPAVKEFDTEELFADGETVKLAKQETAGTPAAAPPSLLPLLIGTAILTGAALFLYHSRKRGKADGR
ncbi:hypothetical protein ACYSNR_00540 [Enterococcus sp. LJL128]